MYMYGWFCSPETLTTLLMDYTPIQNKSKKKKKDKVVAFEMSFKKRRNRAPGRKSWNILTGTSSFMATERCKINST